MDVDAKHGTYIGGDHSLVFSKVKLKRHKEKKKNPNSAPLDILKGLKIHRDQNQICLWKMMKYKKSD